MNTKKLMKRLATRPPVCPGCGLLATNRHDLFLEVQHRCPTKEEIAVPRD